MQRLGLNGSDFRDYLTHVLGSHNFTIIADVLETSGKPIESVRETLLDGQVNIQREGPIRRTCSLQFYDPDRRLHLDADSPLNTTLFLDRMVRVQHVVRVPGVGRVTATPFIGPVTKVSRDGDVVTVECHDKAAFAVRGRPPLTVRKGQNSVAAIKRIMAATGETKFRLPEKNARRLKRPYSVGWSDEASPWIVASKIAESLNLQLAYSCDGYLTLRPVPQTPAVKFDRTQVTVPIQVDYDATQVWNAVRVQGTLKPKKKPKGKKQTDKQTKTKVEKVAATAVARARHPLSPDRLGRNGADRYLPKHVTDVEFRRQADAAELATRLLKQGLVQATAGVSTATVPLFHLDDDDVVQVETDTTTMRLRFSEASIPLGVSGDMTIGNQRRVSVRRRRR